MNIYRMIDSEDGVETFERMPKRPRFDDDKRTEYRPKKDKQPRRQERREIEPSFA